jgi:hypothetical protein
VIHMSMLEEQDIQGREVPRPERRLHQAPGPELCRSSTDPDTVLEGRIGQQPGTMKVEKHRGMTQPGNGEPVVGPDGGLRA